MEFVSPGAFSRAFDVVMEADAVASCSAEPEGRRIRIVARSNDADALAERLYLDGGMTWCTRHDLLLQRPAQAMRARARR
ncbi:MAG TPA: hypothetical protein VFG80_07235 [Myxococcota bacterium]|nr:hypothetical protein [Myxococcota bacterium]